MPVSFFLPAGQCGDAAADLWVQVDAPDGAEVVLALDFTPGAASASDGSQVFAFFDDFDGASLDTGRWSLSGNGSVALSGGVLESTGAAILQSQAAVVSAGQSIAGIRLAANSISETDVELGVGDVEVGQWSADCLWDGLTFVSWQETTYAFDSPAGSPCNDVDPGLVNAPLGTPWVDLSPAPATYLTAEFWYDDVAGHAEGFMQTSRGASFSYAAPDGCSLPTQMPMLVVLDHFENDTPTQRLDYVYVRPRAANEPSVQLIDDSPLACSDVSGG